MNVNGWFLQLFLRIAYIILNLPSLNFLSISNSSELYSKTALVFFRVCIATETVRCSLKCTGNPGKEDLAIRGAYLKRKPLGSLHCNLKSVSHFHWLPKDGGAACSVLCLIDSDCPPLTLEVKRETFSVARSVTFILILQHLILMTSVAVSAAFSCQFWGIAFEQL